MQEINLIQFQYKGPTFSPEVQAHVGQALRIRRIMLRKSQIVVQQELSDILEVEEGLKEMNGRLDASVDECRIANNYVSRVENGHMMPSPTRLIALCKVLNWDLEGLNALAVQIRHEDKNAKEYGNRSISSN